MDDEISIAADRRREMRVTAQMQTEMGVVFRDVFGLSLSAEHDIVDDVLVLGALHLCKDAVELARRQHLTLGDLDVDRGKEFGEGIEFLERRLAVRAVNQGLMC